MQIIAEIGSNWKRDTPDESFECIKEHFKVAKACGATAVKLQLFNSNKLYSRERAPKQWETVRRFEVPLEWLYELNIFAKSLNVEFWASVFDKGTAGIAANYVDCLKIASGDLTNCDLVSDVYEIAVKNDCDFAISTGAATQEETDDAMFNIPTGFNTVNRCYGFQCVSMYPASSLDYNIDCLGDSWTSDVDVFGISDHTLGCDRLLIGTAVGYGCKAFEKHFKLEDSDSPDYSFSLTPDGFADYCECINTALAILGDGMKKPVAGEESERIWARRGKDGLRPKND